MVELIVKIMVEKIAKIMVGNSFQNLENVVVEVGKKFYKFNNCWDDEY